MDAKTNGALVERIAVRGSDDAVDMFLIGAMVHEDGRNVIDKYMPDLERGNHTVEVALTINGRPAPFVAVLRGFFERLEADFDSRVAQEAKRAISEAGLSGIEEALREAEWKIERAIEAAISPESAP